MTDLSSEPARAAPGRLLRMPEVERETGLSRATIYRRIQDGSFPPPWSLGARASRWPESEIDAWKRSLSG